jgi:glyoxylase-like metal-dependent hydrolase (beta-lactamase superfamily II)
MSLGGIRMAMPGLWLFLIWPIPTAFSQVDLSGDWAVRIHEDQAWRGPGAEIGEYEGLPLSPAGRMKASTWSAASLTLPERQCNPLPADDFTDISGMRIWKEVDPVTQQVIAWHEYTEWQAQERVIWMDGRPHPSPYAPHTWQGFSTGKWEGNQLAITTTHLKMAMYERHGLFRSDIGTLFERWIRHGDYLTVMLIISDPVYLAAPFIRTRNYELSLSQQLGGYSCTPAAEIANRPQGYVAHYLPDKNPFLKNGTVRYHVPDVAVGGGPETMYPEFEAKIKNPSATVSAPFPYQPPSVEPTPPMPASQADFDKIEISVLPVQGSVYLLAGAGGNTTVHVGENSVTVVDTQLEPLSGKILAAIRKISNRPIRYVINTNSDPDHIGGNAQIAKAGSSIGGSNIGRDLGAEATTGAAIIAHEGVLKRISVPTGVKSSIPFAAWPTETYETSKYELFDGEAIQIIHEPAAHTDGDSIVFFRRSDVISAGDVFSTVTYPIIESQRGGSISGTIAALNHIIDLTVPRDKQEGGTYVIPGHGRICDEADVVEYRDMVTVIRDRIADLIQQHKTLDEIKAAHPTLDYDARYDRPAWTKDQFIEAVYADLIKSNRENKELAARNAH